MLRAEFKIGANKILKLIDFNILSLKLVKRTEFVQDEFFYINGLNTLVAKTGKKSGKLKPLSSPKSRAGNGSAFLQYQRVFSHSGGQAILQC